MTIISFRVRVRGLLNWLIDQNVTFSSGISWNISLEFGIFYVIIYIPIFTRQKASK